jgi:hypothetical protein
LKNSEVAAENNLHLNRAMFSLPALSLIWGNNGVVMKKALKYVGAFTLPKMLGGSTGHAPCTSFRARLL